MLKQSQKLDSQKQKAKNSPAGILNSKGTGKAQAISCSLKSGRGAYLNYFFIWRDFHVYAR